MNKSFDVMEVANEIMDLSNKLYDQQNKLDDWCQVELAEVLDKWAKVDCKVLHSEDLHDWPHPGNCVRASVYSDGKTVFLFTTDFSGERESRRFPLTALKSAAALDEYCQSQYDKFKGKQ
jgi:hypothetical protein